MPRFESGFLFVGCIFLLIAVVLAVCLIRRLRVSPQPLWVLTLGLCIASVTLAIMEMRNAENAPLICLGFALVSFVIGFFVSLRKD